MNNVDPRVARTKQLLTDALINLIVEHGYDSVTVRQVVQRAGVNRSTFYLDFRDKQDIITSMEDTILSELAKCVRNPAFTYETASREYEDSNKPIESAVALFEHIEKYAPLYRTLLVEREFRGRVTAVVRKELLPFSHNEFELAFASNGIVGVILFWLESGKTETVTEMSLWLTQFSLHPGGGSGFSYTNVHQ